MASKHDAKAARANMWVTHQNLARAKGGRPGFQHKPKPPVPRAPATKPVPAPEAPAAEPTTKD